MILVYVFLIILVGKLLYNLGNYIAACYCHSMIKRCSPKLSYLSTLTNRLLKNASLLRKVVYEAPEDTSVIHCEPIGNYISDRLYHNELCERLEKAIGFYALRMLDCFNPFYWIFLPWYIINRHNTENRNEVRTWIGIASSIAYWAFVCLAEYLLQKLFDNSAVLQSFLEWLNQN